MTTSEQLEDIMHSGYTMRRVSTITGIPYMQVSRLYLYDEELEEKHRNAIARLHEQEFGGEE